MAKLAAKKKPTKPDAPKKPSSRSKTGNAECSQAASNWQLSIRGKATLNPGTYQTLAKCRALSKSGQMADAQGRTGKLSDQGAAALKGRLQKRFDSGLITQKSRQDRLETLLKQRAEKGKPVVAKNAMTEEEYLGSKGLSRSGFGDVALHRMPGMNEQNKTRKRLIEMQRQKDESYQSQRDAARAEYAQKKAAGEIREPSREERLVAIASGHEDNAQVQAARRLLEKQAAKLTPPPAVQAAPKAEAKPAFALKSDSRPAGMTSKNQGSFLQAETDIERSVRLESASKPKPLAGQGDMFDVTKQRLAPTASAARVLAPAKGVPLKSAVKAVKGKLLERAATQSGVATLRTDLILADPNRFQYKMNTSGPIGVTDQFKETTTWNRELAGVVQVWKDPSNKQTYIVNGHHRFELAQRLGVKRLNVQYIQAKDASEARSKGALTNIAEGRGTSIDAARFFREQTDVKDWTSELKGRGISLSERTAREGLALKEVAPKIWRDVVDEMTPVSRAVAIGQSKLREEDQLKLYRKASEGNWTAGKTAEFGTELKRAPLVKSGEASLFGDDNFVNTAEHRAALADKFKTSLKSGKKLFGTVSRSRNAGRLEAAGNQIDRETSAAIAQANDKALMAFDIERKYGSRTSRLLDRYASQIGQGDKLERVYGGFESRVTRALQRDIEKPFEMRLAKRKARLAALSR